MLNEVSLRASFSWARMFNGSMMVFGTAVGAGMLGIPLMTAQGGFGSALSATFLVWFFMTVTGLLLLEVTCHMPKGTNFITISSQLLGRKGKWVTVVFFLFLYYAFLVAYFSGSAPLFGFCLSYLGFPDSSFFHLAFFLGLFGGVILLGTKMIQRTNLVLSLGMLLTFPVLVFLGASGVTAQKLYSAPLSISSAAIPVLFGAFGYHNVIPSLSHSLNGEKKTLRASIILGTFLAFILYGIWQWLVLGSFSAERLQEMLEKGLPVTYALAESSRKEVFILGQMFGFFALTTSFLGVSFSLVDFIQDGLQQRVKRVSRFLCVLLALLPPLFCVLYNPYLFDRALGVAGGFGEALLNGILPVLLFMKWASVKKYELTKGMKLFLGSLLLFSGWVIFLEMSHLLK